MLTLLAQAVPAAAKAAASVPAAKGSAAPINLTPDQLQQMLQNQPALTYHAQTPLQAHAAWLTHTLAGVFILAAIFLVGLLAVQTTKQEGLSGTVGGRVESTYRGRLGFEGQIARVTGIVAVSFVIVATIVSLTGI